MPTDWAPWAVLLFQMMQFPVVSYFSGTNIFGTSMVDNQHTYIHMQKCPLDQLSHHIA